MMNEKKIAILRVVCAILFVGAWIESTINFGLIGFIVGGAVGAGLALAFAFIINLIDKLF